MADSARSNSFFACIRLLTIFPAPAGDAPPGPKLLYWFSAVGLLMGIILVGLDGILLQAGFHSPVVPAAILTAAGLILTRGLHIDGLGDTFDALGSPGNSARRLEIMKDPRIGSFGTSAIVILLILKTSALSSISIQHRIPALLLSVSAARCMAVAACRFFRYARVDGLGAAYIGHARWTHVLVAVMTVVAAALFFKMSVVLFFPVVIASAFIVLVIANRALNGITGDVLGAAIEISECAGLLVFASMS